MVGVEEHDEGRHTNDDNMIKMPLLPLLLLLADNLKKKSTQLGGHGGQLKGGKP
jgi:hypothetical protein